MKRDKIRNTILKLLDAHSADELSVKMVCADAGISKQTLYNNYYGILGAIEEAVGELLEEATAGYTDNHDWIPGLRSILYMIASRKNLFNHLYNSKYREDLLKIIYINLGPIVAAGVVDCAEKTDSEIDERTEKILTGFYMDICMGIIGRFIHDKMSENPEKLVQIYNTILEDHDTKSVLKNLSALNN